MTTVLQDTDRKQHKTELNELLSQDHQRLDKLFEDLMMAFKADAREEAACLWSKFETGLLAHLELEEKHILPEFAKVDAAEAAALIDEHDQIRAKLGELGVGVDLHLTRADAVTELVRVLRAHARREDALMYRWMQANLPEEARSTIRAHVIDVIRKLVVSG